MGFTRKEREELDRLSYDPALGYQTWPQPNASYKHITTQPIIRQEADSPQLTSDTLLGTCMFLAMLLLVGFVAGYALRGNAYAGASDSSLSAMAVAAVPAAPGLDIVNGADASVSSIGTPAPDELVALHRSANGDTTSLIRVHSVLDGDLDAFSLINLSSTGELTELMRREVTATGIADMVRLDDGSSVVAIAEPDAISVIGLKPNGQTKWTRNIATAPANKAEVRAIALASGATVVTGPTDSADRIGVTYITEDGEIAWHRSFKADAGMPDVTVQRAAENSVVLAMRSDVSATDERQYTFVRLGQDGQDIWLSAQSLGETSRLSGLSVGRDGSVFALVTGEATSLVKLDRAGQWAWNAAMPQAKFFQDISLTMTEAGNPIVAISYALANDRLDVWLEERDTTGALIGESSLTLPGSSSIDAFARTTAGNYLIAGSVLPERFADTDVFIKQVAFIPTAPIAPAATSVAVVPEPLAEEIPDTNAADTDKGADDPQMAASTDMSADVVEQDAMMVADSDVAAAEAASELSPMVVTAETPEDLQFEEDSGAAISRFVSIPALETPGYSMGIAEGTGVQAQCRFSCLDADNASSEFPMWRAIEAPPGAFSAGLPDIHELTCRAANGVRNPATTPDCAPS